MKDRTKNIILITVSIIALVLLLRVVFDEQIDDFERYVQEREHYEGGPEEYDKNLEALGDWIENYKQEHPGSTDEDASRAWEAAWEN